MWGKDAWAPSGGGRIMAEGGAAAEATAGSIAVGKVDGYRYAHVLWKQGMRV